MTSPCVILLWLGGTIWIIFFCVLLPRFRLISPSLPPILVLVPSRPFPIYILIHIHSFFRFLVLVSFSTSHSMRIASHHERMGSSSQVNKNVCVLILGLKYHDASEEFGPTMTLGNHWYDGAVSDIFNDLSRSIRQGIDDHHDQSGNTKQGL